MPVLNYGQKLLRAQGSERRIHTHLHRHSDHCCCCCSYRVCLVLAAVELMAVIKDVLIGGVETGFDTVLHHLTGSGWRLQLLDLERQDAQLTETSEWTISSPNYAWKQQFAFWRWKTSFFFHPERQFNGSVENETKKTSLWRRRDLTFILKNVMLVRRSTVDLRSCSLSGLLAGKLFCSQTGKK